MRIFVAYGYNERDRWIEEVVFPLITAFDSKVVHGKDLQGEILSQEIQKRIKTSHALLAFCTRRDQLADGKWTTHRWVTDELAFASQIGKSVAEVRELQVDSQAGIAGDRARIEYDEANRFGTMIQLTSTLVRWHQQFRRIHLVPRLPVMRDGAIAEAGNDWLRAQMRERSFQCRYRILDADYPTDFRPVELQLIQGRFYFHASDVAPGGRIQVELSAEGQAFTSEYESTDDINLNVTLLDTPVPSLFPRRDAALIASHKSAEM
jgi:hypothetical protein